MTGEQFANYQRKVHLDMHLPEDAPGMFTNFDPVAYVKTLRDADVNSVALFAHCHHGNCYFDTKVGHKHVHLQADYLRELAEECRRHDIATTAYVSCNWNARGQEHPDWIQRDSSREPRFHQGYWWWMCMNTGYGDFLAGLVREITEGYPVDGLWFDITYVAAPGCYCEVCRRLFRERYGREMPVDPEPATEDAREMEEFRMWTETNFRARMCELIRSIDPTKAVSWNHASDITQMYLDNDLLADVLFRETHTPEDWLPSFQARWFQQFGIPHEGCTSRFHYGGWSSFSYKSANKLHVEAAGALAHGGIIDIGDQALHDGTLDRGAYEIIGEVYGRAKVVEEHCRETKSVPNIAVLHSSRSHHLAKWAEPVNLRQPINSVFGAGRALNETHRHYDILCERFLDRLGEYHALIVPDQIVLTDDETAAIRDYVQAGGAVMAAYRCGMFDERNGTVEPNFLREVCGVNPLGFAPYSVGYVTGIGFDVDVPNGPVVFRSPEHGDSPNVIPAMECEAIDAEPLAELTHPIYERTPEHFYSHTNAAPAEPSGFGSIFRRTLGDGQVIYFPFDIFKFYRLDSYIPMRNIVEALLDQIAPVQEAYVDAPSQVEAVLRERDGRRYLHLVNYANMRFGGGFMPIVVDDVPPIFEIKVRVRGQAAAVTEIPSGHALEFEQDGEYTVFTIPRLDIHSIIAVDMG